MNNRRISKKSVMTRHFDWFLLILTLLLSAFGVVAIYSATRVLDSNVNAIVQTASLVIGAGLAITLCFFDYEQFKNLIKPIYIFCVAILILVLVIGTGEGEWGARSWIRIGSIGIQPSEIAKVCFIITFSYHLQIVESKINKPLVILGLLLHLGVIVGLIMLQPDLGSVLVFIFMFLVMLFVAKISYKYIIPVLALGVVSVPLAYTYLLSEYQRQRIDVFLNPESDPTGGGWHVIQSKLAVGAGQVWGSGYLKGIQTQMGWLPTPYTDFIFSTISKEWGFIGAAILVHSADISAQAWARCSCSMFLKMWGCVSDLCRLPGSRCPLSHTAARRF